MNTFTITAATIRNAADAAIAGKPDLLKGRKSAIGRFQFYIGDRFDYILPAARIKAYALTFGKDEVLDLTPAPDSIRLQYGNSFARFLATTRLPQGILLEHFKPAILDARVSGSVSTFRGSKSDAFASKTLSASLTM